MSSSDTGLPARDPSETMHPRLMALTQPIDGPDGVRVRICDRSRHLGSEAEIYADPADVRDLGEMC